MSEQPKANGGLLILVLAIFGILLGGCIGLLAAPRSSLNENPDPQAQTFAAVLRPAEIVFGAVFSAIGAGIGGVLGAAAGIIINSRRTAVADSNAPVVVATDSRSREAEIARLEREIAQIQHRVDELRSQNEL